MHLLEAGQDSIAIFDASRAVFLDRQYRYIGETRIGLRFSRVVRKTPVDRDRWASVYVGLDTDSVRLEGVNGAARSFELPRPAGMEGVVQARPETLGLPHYWFVHTVENRGFTMTLLDSLGSVRAQWEARPRWWVNSTVGSQPDVITPGSSSPADRLPRPTSAIWDAVLSSSGFVSVLARHSDSLWRNVARRDAHSRGNMRSMIEVFDPRLGQLIGRVEVRGMPVGFADFQHVATFHEDDSGFPVIEVWRLTVVRP